MTLTIKQGDLIAALVEGNIDIVMHGCNCFSAMGGGFARLLADAFPVVEDVDRNDIRTPRQKLGHYTCVTVGTNNTLILNGYTQFRPGKDFMPTMFPELLWIINRDYPGETIAIPRIGCGIGGGDWADVEDMLMTHAPQVNWEVWCYG